jgi:methylated-DNA-[protein]-cysteine S-methyltransferase
MASQAQRARSTPVAAIFPTDLGWFGLVGTERRVVSLTIGHSSAAQVRNSLGRNDLRAAGDLTEDDWFPELRRDLEAYCRGELVDFRHYAVAFPQQTAFQRAVIDAARRIPFGRTLTYQELAAKAGSPGAARAVGNVMASNPVPIIVPCHRVVASGGGLGGYSAPQGIDLKRRLLQLERQEMSIVLKD